MKKLLVIMIANLVLSLTSGCGSTFPNREPYPLHDIPQGATGVQRICQNWSDAQPLGTTRFAGSAYCFNGQLYALFDRYATGGYQGQGFYALADGTYTMSQTTLPCDFTVSACTLTEQ